MSLFCLTTGLFFIKEQLLLIITYYGENTGTNPMAQLPPPPHRLNTIMVKKQLNLYLIL